MEAAVDVGDEDVPVLVQVALIGDQIPTTDVREGGVDVVDLPVEGNLLQDCASGIGDEDLPIAIALRLEGDPGGAGGASMRYVASLRLCDAPDSGAVPEDAVNLPVASR